jgi:hypothetical protein
MASAGITGLDSSVLLGFYQAKLSASPTAIAAGAGRAALGRGNSATAGDITPWSVPQPSQSAQDAKALSTTDFIDTSNVPTTALTDDAKVEQDNQKLFALYSALSTLAYIAKMGQRSDMTSGQLAGLNARFQTGLAQIQDYIAKTGFNNFSLQTAKPSASVTSKAGIAFSDYTYQTRTLATAGSIDQPLPGVSAADSFTISVKKAGITSDVAIDLAQVPGALTLGNIVSYINSQLVAGGFSTRFQKTSSGVTATSAADASYGLQITPGANETVSLSAASAPALYMVGNSGTASATSVTNAGKGGTTTTTNTAADQQGRLTKLTGLAAAPASVFSVNQPMTGGNSTAQATAVDAGGNIYVIGSATGDIGKNQINQASSDAYLTKYDSAGNVVWSKLLGSADTAGGFALATDPSGGIVVSGVTTANLMPTAIADGNSDSFVARYDKDGNQSWIKQIQTLANNQANAVSIDASGHIYIGGGVSGYPLANPVNGRTEIAGGVIGKGQTALGGGDAWLAKLDSKGNILAENQFGTTGADSVAATATADDGSLYVASLQNGHAVISKYAGGDITAAPLWSQDLGDLAAGGAIGGLRVAGGQLYVSGTTSNADLTGGGAARIAAPSSGGTDAFLFHLTDNGASVTADRVTYIGTDAADKGGAVTVAADGTVYLTGTTRGTFAGQQRNVENVDNGFVTAIAADGSLGWTRQLGGASGQSTGAGIAIDTEGASVLDALGLPRGTITLNQSVDLTSQTTLRAGDSFQIKIGGVAPRTATIRIDAGETLDSLARKINGQLGSLGKASVSYGSGAEGLKLEAGSTTPLELFAGPADFDALARLGIAPGTLSTDTSGTATSAPGAKPAFGLGLSGTLDISTKMGADLARSGLLGVLSAVQSAYQTSNKPAAPPPGPGNISAGANPYTTSQLANYNLALALLG